MIGNYRCWRGREAHLRRDFPGRETSHSNKPKGAN